MDMEYDVTASIVLYNNDRTIRNAVRSFLNTSLSVKLYLVDNSETDKQQKLLSDLLMDDRIEYIFNNKNVGFGKGHNIALENIYSISRYHLILNPDVTFEAGVIEELFDFMERNEDVGQVLPKVIFKSGELQKLCKLLPNPFNLFGRRFCMNFKWAEKLNKQYELDGFNYDRCINLSNLSGCFMFLRTKDVQEIGGYEARYFMYMEDIDLTRRMHRIANTVFYPYVTIVHEYEKGSYSNIKLLKHHIMSAIKYFNKWGWIFDMERRRFNAGVIENLKQDLNFNASVYTKFFKPKKHPVKKVQQQLIK